MYLAPEGDELAIAEAAAGYLADAIPLARLQAPSGSADLDAETRLAMAGLGWFALALPQAHGGSGLSEVEHALFFREAGRHCAPLDIVAQCLAVNSAQDDTLRAQLVSGAAGVALAVSDGARYRLLGAPAARYALLAAPDGASLIALAGVAAEVRPALDPVNSMRTCATLPAAADGAPGGRVWRLGQLACAAMLVGLAEAALDLIADYAKVRETFGRKIGAWQAVRHPIADMAVRLEAARAQLWFAAAACKVARGDAAAHLDAAKHLANRAAVTNAGACIQLHGGIGVTREHGAHFLLKHALLLARLFGGERVLLGALLHARLED